MSRFRVSQWLVAPQIESGLLPALARCTEPTQSQPPSDNCSYNRTGNEGQSPDSLRPLSFRRDATYSLVHGEEVAAWTRQGLASPPLSLPIALALIVSESGQPFLSGLGKSNSKSPRAAFRKFSSCLFDVGFLGREGPSSLHGFCWRPQGATLCRYHYLSTPPLRCTDKDLEEERRSTERLEA